MTIQAEATFDRLETREPHAPRSSDDWLSTLDDGTETAIYGRLVRRAVQTLEARCVLDVGCGVGTPTLEAARAGARRVIGIDMIRENVEHTRRAIRRSGLGAQVSAHHASWRDVTSGRFALNDVDLVVSNPPYVPDGRGTAVDGGPFGTTVLDAIIDGVPASVTGLALLFGSLSDPLQLIERLHARGFAIEELLVEPVPFGRYTSVPETLASLKRLRDQGRAWFCDTSAGHGAPHAYLTMGVVAHRLDDGASHTMASWWRERILRLLGDYQRTGHVADDGSARLQRRAFDAAGSGIVANVRPPGRASDRLREINDPSVLAS